MVYNLCHPISGRDMLEGGGRGLGAMAVAAAAYIALVSPYNIDLQRSDVAGVPADVISACVLWYLHTHRKNY